MRRFTPAFLEAVELLPTLRERSDADARRLSTTRTVEETSGTALRCTVVRPHLEDPYTQELEHFHDIVVSGRTPKITPRTSWRTCTSSPSSSTCWSAVTPLALAPVGSGLEAGDGDLRDAQLRRTATIMRGMDVAGRLLAAERLDLARLVTHRFPLERIDEAFTTAVTKPEGFVKAVVTMADLPAPPSFAQESGATR